MIERFSEVLNLHHNYSIFLLIKAFTLKKCNNEQANLLVLYLVRFILLHLICLCLWVVVVHLQICVKVEGVLLKHAMLKSRLRCILIEPDP